METASTINSGKKMEKPSFDVKTLDLFFSAALPTQSDISNAKALPPLISQHSSKGDLANTRQWTQKLEQRSIHADITDITWRDNKIYLYNPTFFGAAQSSWCQPRKKKNSLTKCNDGQTERPEYLELSNFLPHLKTPMDFTHMAWINWIDVAKSTFY